VASQTSRKPPADPTDGTAEGRLSLVPDAHPARARHDRIIAQVRGPRAYREGSPDSPDLTAAARLEAAEERDELAYFRDIAALARDLLAEARSLAMTRRDDGAAESAADRALAAADRRAAARDRELAAQERLRALVDREALAREARAPSQDL
jgi:hypothetical protein